MSSIEDFKAILKCSEPLAKYSYFKIGGPAQFLLEPRDADELQQVVLCCVENEIPMRVLGGASNVLIKDSGVQGAVIRIYGDEFAKVQIEGTTVTAGAGVLLSNLVSQTVKAGLAGMEGLVGIPGTIGGALHGNAGGTHGDIGQYVTSVSVLTARGEKFVRTADELSFSYRESSVNELAILEATFELKQDDSEEVTNRMKKNWIMKKSNQPLTHQSAGCIFKNPRGMHAGALIEQAGLKGTRIGGAEISDRHANYIINDENATTENVLDLINLAQNTVSEKFGVELELEIELW
ncbi:UDP-N-acetylmuramate dehydrogenase [Gimesia aquarii]|uniref:UDP-N-acetylenolpyruvoylglucosamine reductase n=1 Tax=Gimesia aquarii TaxID=2527964 RepID=A0A517WRH2_9PLAN|nr:UDP-N-acetylmuramate dehydrogenase [Gimesia aquarii]QDU07860.1 UDP-N-acetylenolpyruvoylglucosamine reductase MurB [Gimesia aquarii]